MINGGIYALGLQTSAKSVIFQLSINTETVTDAQKVIINAIRSLCYSMLLNLIRNAVEASPENFVVHVDIASQSQHVTIIIQNTGAVPPPASEKVFS